MSWRGDYIHVLTRLRVARESLGISQPDMAARLGCARSTLQRYENGERDVPAALLFRWHAILGLSLRSEAAS